MKPHVFFYPAGMAWLLFPAVLPEAPTSLDAAVPAVSFNPMKILHCFRLVDWSSMWDIFLVRFFLGFALLIYRSNFAMWLDYKFGASTIYLGYIISYSGLVGTLSSFGVGVISRWYKNDATLLLHTGIIQAVCISMMSLVSSLWWLPLVITPLGVANAIARVAATKVTMERAHGHDLGGLLGLGASILSLARMLSPVVGGIAQEMHSSGTTIAATVFAMLGIAVMMLSPKFKADRQHTKTE